MKLFCKRKKQQKVSLTPEQIAAVRKVYEERGCAYCGWLLSAVSLCSGSDEAISARHTAIPGVIHCPYWMPDKRYIRAKLKGVANNDKSLSNDKK